MARAVISDQGWSWIILVQSCITCMLQDGFRMSLGIFYSQFIDTLHLTPAQAGMVVAAVNGMFMLPAPLATLLTQKIGARATVILGTMLTSAGLIGSAFCHSFWPLFCSFGLLCGTGCCLTFTTMLCTLPRWFEKYRQFAPALVMASSGLGIFVMAPLIQLLVDEYTWRGTVIIVAGLCLQGVVLGMTMFPTPPSVPAIGSSKSVTRTVCTSLSFWLHLIAAFLIFGMPLFTVFVVRHLTENRGFTPQEAAFLVGICGVTSFAGRILVVLSLIFKKFANKNVRFVIYNWSSLFGAICCALIAYLHGYSTVAVACGIMGFMQGLKLGSIVGVTLDVLGPKLFQTGFGFFHLTGGVSLVVVPPIAGYLAQTFNSYDPVFYLSATALFVSFLIGSVVHVLEIRKDRNRSEIGENTTLKIGTANLRKPK